MCYNVIHARMTAVAIGIVAAAVGCKTGAVVTLKDSSGINVGSISFEESTWPIVSYFTGPTFRFWVRDGVTDSIEVRGSACLTNSTSAIGIYQSSEVKQLNIEANYDSKKNSVDR